MLDGGPDCARAPAAERSTNSKAPDRYWTTVFVAMM
jgi:hypothetical protein